MTILSVVVDCGGASVNVVLKMIEFRSSSAGLTYVNVMMFNCAFSKLLFLAFPSWYLTCVFDDVQLG